MGGVVSGVGTDNTSPPRGGSWVTLRGYYNCCNYCFMIIVLCKYMYLLQYKETNKNCIHTLTILLFYSLKIYLFKLSHPYKKRTIFRSTKWTFEQTITLCI